MTPPHLRGLFFDATFWLAATVLWTVSVLGLAVSPQSKTALLALPYGDKILHAIAFLLGTICWAMALRGNQPSYLRLMGGAAASLIIGLLIEYFQSFVPGRESDSADILADIVGVGAAILILLVAQRRSTHNTSAE